MNEIVSRQNSKFKIWSSLVESRGIKKSGKAIVSGRKLVEEFISQNPKAVEDLLFPIRSTVPKSIPGVQTYALASELFNELDVLGTKSPLLVVKTPALAKWKSAKPHGLELVVALSDPGNLGALIRSAEAFGVSQIILTEEACSPFLPKTLRAASGAAFRVKMVQTGPLKEVQIPSAFCLDMNGQDITGFTWPEDLHLILGEEGRGLPKSLKAAPLSIPMAGHVESLNATAAASVALFSYRTLWHI